MGQNAFLEFKVILKDSDPSTPQGKIALRDKLISFLEVNEARVDELISSLPVTLKSGVSEEEARAFAKILRELGALVFVEKTIVNEESESGKSLIHAKFEPKEFHKHPYFLTMLLTLAIIGILSSNLLKRPVQQGFVVDVDSLKKMLDSQKLITSKNNDSEVKSSVEKILTGKSFKRPVALNVDLVEKDGKLERAIVKFATESPGDTTPEQIIRGVQLPWLQEGEVQFDRSQVRKVKNKNKERLKSEAKLYIIRGDSSERIVAESSIEITPTLKGQARICIFRIRYKPKDQFESDPFFIEFKQEAGYSIILNQEVTITEKEKIEESPLIKLSAEEEAKKIEKEKKEKEKAEKKLKNEQVANDKKEASPPAK